MALATLTSRALLGMESPSVNVEVHASNGLPSFNIVGLPETSVKESKERVRSALMSLGYQLPPKRLTVNLAPADLPKSGGRYDLVIALGVLLATEQLTVENLPSFECYGELALNGQLRAVKGLLPSLLAASQHNTHVIIPEANLAEAKLLLSSLKANQTAGLKLYAVADLQQACQVLLGQLAAIDLTNMDLPLPKVDYSIDLADIQGQIQAKRALEIAASGHHSMMMVGPPGAGKSLLANALISLLPPLHEYEAIELAAIRSLVGEQLEMDDFYQRPLVQPHHTASAAALVGGGSVPKPGALSLAHHGVLFLDELPEFNRAVLEALREPLETKKVNISRVQQHISYPADNLLISAMNPTPSGFFADDHLGRCCQLQN